MTADVARVLGAEVIGLGAEAPWPFASARDGHGPEFEKLIQTAEANIAAAQSAFRAGLVDPAIKTAWRSDVACPNVALARNASVADLILAYRTTVVVDLSVYATADALVMEAGLPVLLLPTRETAFKIDSILLAWKSTRESRRAISVVLPLLMRAKRVLVSAVCHADEIATAEQELADVSQRLAGDGVDAAARAEVDASGNAGLKLLDIARAEHIDLIVAGGYGHTRLREWVMGGVTRDLIADGGRFVLLSH
jgi:nucleotide-binding universal stress UspA family protein